MIDRITSRLEMKRELATLVRHLSSLAAPVTNGAASTATPG